MGIAHSHRLFSLCICICRIRSLALLLSLSLLLLISWFYDDLNNINVNIKINVKINKHERRGGQPSFFMSWTSDSNKSKVVVGVVGVHGDPTMSLFCFLLLLLLSKKNIRRWRGSFCTSKKTTLSLSHL